MAYLSGALRYTAFLQVLFFSLPVFSISKTDLIKQVEQHSNPIKTGFSARFSSKTSVANKTMSDSGTFYFSPPNRNRIEFLVSRIMASSCGDTTWTKAANGDVTRSISSGSGLPGGSSGTTSLSSPDLLSYLKKGDFTIKQEDSAAIVVVITIAVENRKTPFTLYIDPQAYVIKRMEFPYPMGGMFRIGYRYKRFEGHLVLEEVNTVMGSLGFSRMQMFDYQKIRKKRSFFRGF